MYNQYFYVALQEIVIKQLCHNNLARLLYLTL